jgi:hypothetical protein
LNSTHLQVFATPPCGGYKVYSSCLDIPSLLLKLKLLNKHINEQNLDHFPFYKTALESSIKPFEWLMLKNKFVSIIQQLRNVFSSRFADLYTSSNEIRLFQKPFAIDINEVLAQMRMEVIELRSNDSLKDAFSEGNLLQFYAGLPILNFPAIKTFAKKMITAFDSTYIREQAFSVMNYGKNKYCSRLANEHLYAMLRISSSSFEADIHKLAGDIQPQKSH